MAEIKSNSRKLYGVIAIVVLVGMIAFFAANRPRGIALGNEVSIGAILPLSGENASFGTSARAAYILAAEDAKAAGLPPVKLIFGDSRLDKDAAIKEFYRIADVEKAPAFVETTGSGVALTLAPLATQRKVVLMSGINSSPELTTKGGDFFFRVIPSDAYSGEVLAEWTTGKGFTNGALIFNQQNGWATGFKAAISDAYRKRGGALPDDRMLAVIDDTVNFSSAILRLKESHPQSWFIVLMGRQACLFVKQAVSLGIEGPFYGVDNLAQSEFVETAGGAAKFARMALPAEVDSPRGQTFAARYRKAENREADAIAFKAYDAYWTLVTAIQKAQGANGGVSGTAIRDALKTISVDGIAGPIEFDGHHDLKKAMYQRFAFNADGKRVADSSQ